MANMFNKSTEFGGAFKGNQMVLTFQGYGAGYLITSVNASYAIQTARFRELGSNRTYYVEGDSFGNVNLSQVTGPSKSMTPLLRAYSDVCNIANNTLSLSFSPGHCTALSGGEGSITFSFVLFNNWSLNASSQAQMTANTTIAGTYDSVDTDDGGNVVAGAIDAIAAAI